MWLISNFSHCTGSADVPPTFLCKVYVEAGLLARLLLVAQNDQTLTQRSGGVVELGRRQEVQQLGPKHLQTTQHTHVNSPPTGRYNDLGETGGWAQRPRTSASRPTVVVRRCSVLSHIVLSASLVTSSGSVGFWPRWRHTG